MKKLFLLPILLASGFAMMAQNVGIGTATPTEKLKAFIFLLFFFS